MLLVLGVLLALAGAVWLAQGLNLPFAPGSFMTADPTWALIGGVTLAVGAVLIARWVQRRNRREPPGER